MVVFLQSIISDLYVNALCWTFLHSLWQGLVLYMVGGLIMFITRKSSSALRYLVLASLFCLFIIVTVSTFIYQLHNPGLIEPDIDMLQYPGNSALYDADSRTGNIVTDFLIQILHWCNTYSTSIVAIWFLIFILKCYRMMNSLRHLQNIRSHGLTEPPLVWRDKLDNLLSVAGIKTNIRFLESQLVHAPVVIGCLKPILLVPLGLLMNLPTAQAEAILLHELAHIKRRDYLFNLVQNFVENIFFFNPPLLWISQNIRKEREYCCDDFAVGITKNKKVFIQALVSFHESKHNIDCYEMAFPGTKNYLLNRVQRILDGRTKNLMVMEKVSFFFTLLFTTFIVISFTTVPILREYDKENKPVKISPPARPAFKISLPVPEEQKEAIKKEAGLNKTGKRSVSKPKQVKKPSLKSEKYSDTIPKGASQDYIDGYKAGMKYRENLKSEHDGEVLKKIREQKEIKEIGKLPSKKINNYNKRLLLQKYHQAKIDPMKSKAEYYRKQIKTQQEIEKYSDLRHRKEINQALTKQKQLQNKLRKEEIKVNYKNLNKFINKPKTNDEKRKSIQ